MIFASIARWFRRVFKKNAAAPQVGRRNAIKSMLGKVAALLVIPAFFRRRVLAAEAAEAAPEKSPRPRQKASWGMVIDLDLCTACQACVVACRAENNIPVVGPDFLERSWGISWMDIFTEKIGRYPDMRHQLVPAPCNHCENPPCIKVCPVRATSLNDEGLVMQIPSRCIGCRYCTMACPYTRRYFNWVQPEWSETMKNQLNPDVGTRPKGVVEKCTFCTQRIRKLRETARDEDREWSDEETLRLTACAEACPAEAITFGNLADPESTVSRLEKSPRSYRLLEELGTRPKVIYLHEAKWSD